MPDQTTVFEVASVPPHDGRTEFSLRRWDELRGEAIAPRYHSGYSDSLENRLDFLEGCRLLGYEMPPGDEWQFGWEPPAGEKPVDWIKPQQLAIVDTLGLPLPEFAVEVPRRAAKTTTIFTLLLGRCSLRAGHIVTFSAQSGVKSLARLRDWGRRLDRINPPEPQLPSWMKPRKTRHETQVSLFGEDAIPGAVAPTGRGFRVLLGASNMRIEFDNGSNFIVLKPDAEAFRSEAADDVWLDEAQELEPESGADLIAGVLPLMDTRPSARLILSGTTGEAQVGPFWQLLNAGRTAPATTGIIDYAIDPDTPWELIENTETAMQLVAGSHPGIGSLTSIEVMRRRHQDPKLDLPKFAREYLSLWPEVIGAVVIDPTLWEGAALASKPTRPARVAFGLAIKPGGSVAAIAAAWRSPKGIAYVEIVEHRPGTKWLVDAKSAGLPAASNSSGWLQHLSRSYRGSTIAYDRFAESETTATEAERLTPKPRLKVLNLNDITAGGVQLMRDLERGTLRHAGQSGLNAAVAAAGKREVRNEQGKWLWTPVEPGLDITCLDAATRALRNWDQHFARSSGARNRSVMGE